MIAEAETKANRNASAASVVDWDGDGDLDLLVGNIMGEIHWIENTGTKTQPKWGERKPVCLADGTEIKIDSGDAHPLAVDWDGDGVLDLLVGTGNGHVLFYKGSKKAGQKTPALAAPVELTAGGKPIAVGERAKLCVADWNGDGAPDLIVGNFSHEGEDENAKFVGNVFVFLRKKR
jgi:hypothetical protein